MLIFVSTGRCGTTKVAHLLKQKLPEDSFDIYHQIGSSRIANIIGNVMFKFGAIEKVKEILFNWALNQMINSNNLIFTDPLHSMVIPKSIYTSPNVCIVQIERSPSGFAESFFRFSRKKKNSFIAHNFIPFWQPRLLPFENLFSRRIITKYSLISKEKNAFFSKIYMKNPNYKYVDFKDLFEKDVLKQIVDNFFNTDISIESEELQVKINES